MAYVFTINTTFPTQARAQSMLDNWCSANGYNPASGLTKQQFFKREQIVKPLRQASIRTEPSVQIQQIRDACTVQVQQILDAKNAEINSIIIT